MILVLGTGRSGTSAVARVLHQNNIACMGHSFPVSDLHNPLGYYEDLIVKNQFLHHLIQDNPTRFTQQVTEYHAKQYCNTTVLGFKHPTLCSVERDTLIALNPLAIFWCTRKKEQVIKSLLNRQQARYGFASLHLAKTFYKDRMDDLTYNVEGLPFVHKIDLSIHRTDEWIKKQILSVL